jgi:hypothetical protein
MTYSCCSRNASEPDTSLFTGTLLTPVRKSYKGRVGPPDKVHPVTAEVGGAGVVQTTLANRPVGVKLTKKYVVPYK